MKNAFLLAALMFVASCSAPQNKAADEQQSVEPTTAQVSAPVNYQPLPIPLKKDKFIQINIVVADIYQAAKAWAALLDIPVPEITTNKLRHSEEFLTWIANNKDIENFSLFINAVVSENENKELEWITENVKKLKDGNVRKLWENVLNDY